MLQNNSATATPSVTDTVQLLIAQSAPIVTNATNTATSATQVTGLTSGTQILPSWTQELEFTVTGDTISNSGANSVIVTLWDGTVGTGTQIGQSTTIATGGKTPINFCFYQTVVGGSTHTYNIGMHGSGAGTNTLAASATAPCYFTVKALN